MKAHIEPLPSSMQSDGNKMRFVQRVSHLHFRRRFSHGMVFASEDDAAPSFPPLGEPQWRTDWFINGPHAFHSLRRTRRRRTATFRRDRDIAKIDVREFPSGGTSVDHFAVMAGDIRFSVHEVPEEFAPQWARACSIDYYAPIPSAETRDAIAEIVSFVLGRRLLPIGATTYDATGQVIEEEAFNPWGHDIRALCQQGDQSPIPIRDHSGDIERVLADLVPRYIEARQRLNFSDALLAFWLADEAFTPIDLTLYSSAVEVLKKGWFDSKGSKSGGRYMPQKKFQEHFGEMLTQLRAKLNELELPEAIARKCERAWDMGANEQLRAFFQEIGLVVGPVEERAMQARNRPAHGGIRTGANLQEFARHGNAYRTLFIRTFLRLLGYEGPYVDRTTLGYPSKAIAEVAGS